MALGANHAITGRDVKLNPDTAWGTRTQNIQVLGREQAPTGYTNLVSAANYQFAQRQQHGHHPGQRDHGGRPAAVHRQHRCPVGPGRRVPGHAAPRRPNPDLVVSSVTWTPASPSETNAITLSATVSNIGTAAAGATTVNFNLGGTRRRHRRGRRARRRAPRPP